MNSSMFSSGELPQQNCVDARNGAISSGHVTAGECHQRNYRDEFHGNRMAYMAGGFHDMLPDMSEIHSEAAFCGAGDVQRGSAVHLTCSCNGCQQPELFYDDHDYHQSSSHKRYCQRIIGSSTPIGNQTGHLHNLCDRGCCGSVGMRRERSTLGNCVVERTRATSRSSLFVDSLEFQRNAAAVGGMSHFPSTPREVETRSSSMHTESMANSLLHVSPSPAKAPLKQIFLYGWFLMRPPHEIYTADPSTFLSVAIGGYRCPRMEEKDFFGTATVVERLERWKLRTSDGLEVGLMGMINIEKSVASGFSPSLVQCFMIGFPSPWVFMLLNMQKRVSKSSSPGMPSPSATPTSSAAADIPLVQPVVATANVCHSSDCQVGASPDVAEETAPANVSHSSGWQVGASPDVAEEIAPANFSHGSDRQVGASPDVAEEIAPANVSHGSARQVGASPNVKGEIAPANGSHRSDCHVGASPEVTEEKGDAEPYELGKEDSITHKDDIDFEVNQSCKVKVEGRARARRKRYKVPRNYYRRGKRKSSTKSNQGK